MGDRLRRPGGPGAILVPTATAECAPQHPRQRPLIVRRPHARLSLMQLKAAQIILSCRNIRRAEKGRQRGVWLLDHFVGTQQDGSRDGQGERLSSIEVEHKFERAGLLHRQVGRFGTIENAPDVASHFAIRVAKARPVAQQTAVNDIFAPRKDRRYPMLGREQNELSTPAGEERIFGA